MHESPHEVGVVGKNVGEDASNGEDEGMEVFCDEGFGDPGGEEGRGRSNSL